eukprot:COSAG06_NODE_4520_length_4185_cov_13.400147_4_plen_125_part_00
MAEVKFVNPLDENADDDDDDDDATAAEATPEFPYGDDGDNDAAAAAEVNPGDVSPRKPSATSGAKGNVGWLKRREMYQQAKNDNAQMNCKYDPNGGSGTGGMRDLGCAPLTVALLLRVQQSSQL